MSEGENEDDIRRRSILALAGAATAATSGCLDILGLSDSDSHDSNGGGSGQSNAPHPNETAEPQQNQSRDQSEPRQENETTNETGHDQDTNSTEGDEEKRQREPTDEETAVNRSKYNETGVRETVARPESDVEIAGASPFTMPDGTVTVSPTITNVSDEAIDFVDLDIYYLDAQENEVGHSTAIIQDLGAGEIKEFSGSIQPTDLTGEVDDTRVEASPQDYAEG